jgi:hypothetical protein
MPTLLHLLLLLLLLTKGFWAKQKFGDLVDAAKDNKLVWAW